MSKERLEEIEREIERSNNATLKGNSLGAERMILDLHEIGRFEWLVKHAKEQAERVLELEEELEIQKELRKKRFFDLYKTKKMYSEVKNNYIRECKQNKRYRELLKKIKEMTRYDDCREAEIYELVSDEL